jgi:hypothetical protein
MLNFECKVAEKKASWDLANKEKIFPTLLVKNNFMISKIVDQNLKILQSPTPFSDVYQNKIYSKLLTWITLANLLCVLQIVKGNE